MAAAQMEQSDPAAEVAEQDELLVQDADRQRQLAELGRKRDRVPEAPQVFAARRARADMGELGILSRARPAVIAAEFHGSRVYRGHSRPSAVRIVGWPDSLLGIPGDGQGDRARSADRGTRLYHGESTSSGERPDMTASERKMDGFLSLGFRPFFLFAALWALLGMALWVPMLLGLISLPSAFDPVSWHAHEALFGYLGAVLAGFLLTAVPGWTDRRPLAGWPLLGLLALWALGRVAVATSEHLAPWTVAAIDVSFPVVLAGYALREIVIGRNWRNLVVIALIGVFVAGNALFHWEAADGIYAASGHGLRTGLAAAIVLISLIGGRIVPAFTRNWLAARGGEALPAGFGLLDKLSVALTLVALAVWVARTRGDGDRIPAACGGRCAGRTARPLARPGHRERTPGLDPAPRIRVRAARDAGFGRDRPLARLAPARLRPACLDGGRDRHDDARRDDPRDAGPYRP